jgi:UDP:flavonoid glycosyltransferase YjiC (YdhE family)
MGTVMAGLAHGVPLLCVPLGRDQFFNAARVESLGAGITLPADTEAPAIADAVRMLVHNAAMRRGAQRAAEAIARYRNGREAVNDLERLVSGTAAPAAPARVIANDGSDPAARRSA